MNEFLTQIKNTPDLANLFESIQKDSSSHGSGEGAYSGYSSATGAMSMDLSWRDGRRETGHGKHTFYYQTYYIKTLKRTRYNNTTWYIFSTGVAESSSNGHYNSNTHSFTTSASSLPLRTNLTSSKRRYTSYQNDGVLQQSDVFNTKLAKL